MQSLSRIFLIICLSLFMGACAYNSFDEGIASFKIQDYRRAFIRLMPCAEKGNPDAQYAVGYMFYYGQGVVENRKKAWYWIKSAAKQGQPEAVIAMKMLSAHGGPLKG